MPSRVVVNAQKMDWPYLEKEGTYSQNLTFTISVGDGGGGGDGAHLLGVKTGTHTRIQVDNERVKCARVYKLTLIGSAQICLPRLLSPPLETLSPPPPQVGNLPGTPRWRRAWLSEFDGGNGLEDRDVEGGRTQVIDIRSGV
uniref:PLAT domain-containing protein n=1 Tax=Mesocestoides corti TaxID=53468 RepID=A0A5K3EX49_MESCO